MTTRDTFQEQAAFFRLPKEIRIVIYGLTLQNYKQVKVGNRDFNDKQLAPWPLQPSICRTCRLVRTESLEMYYSIPIFVLNIQRPSGESMALSWIARLSATSPIAFNRIRNVSVITGLGYLEPPKEYMINIQQNHFVLATRPCGAAYLYKWRSNMRLWTRLVSGALKKRLRELPSRCDSGFDVAQNLREVIAVVGELSGYGLYEDFPSLETQDSHVRSTSNSNNVGSVFPLLDLPKELRLLVYEHALTSNTPLTIGQRAISARDLTDWQAYPNLTRTSSLLRHESLPVYFACTHFILNIQRVQCEEIVLDWIRRSSTAYPEAFRQIHHVCVVAGSGIRQPPRQYEFYMQQTRLISTIDRPILQPYTLPASRWSPPPWDELGTRLQQMPKKGQPGFDVTDNLRGIIEVLARCSD